VTLYMGAAQVRFRPDSDVARDEMWLWIEG
jgi:hypothetical protein